MKTLKYPLVILFFTLPALADTPACNTGYAELAQKAADKASDRFSVSKGEATSFIAQYRDQTRDFLMWMKGRPYPILGLEDATPLKANLLARAAAGNKAVQKNSPIDLDTIKKELKELLRVTERYPSDFNAFLQDTATKQAQLEAMERALQQGLDSSRNIKLEMPIPKMDGKGNLVEVGMKPLTWDNRVKFDIDLANLRKELQRRLEGPRMWQSKKESYVLDILDENGEPIVFDAMEHIYRVKKLDVYRGEYRDMMSRLRAGQQPGSMNSAPIKNGKTVELNAVDESRFATVMEDENQSFTGKHHGHKAEGDEAVADAAAPKAEAGAEPKPEAPAAKAEPEIDPELKALYDRFDNIYDADGKLRKEFHAPYWAWKRLHWEQFWAELRETATKVKLKVSDNETLQAIKEWAKNLSPEERKAMHVDRLAETFNVGSKSFYVRTVLGIGGTVFGGGGFSIVKGLDLWREWRLESAEKEACAAASNDTKFRACVQDFLQSKFPVAAVKTIVFGDESFLNDTSQIKDKKVRAEVEDLIARRKSYVGTEIQKKENADALDKAIKEVQGAKDPGSDAFREKLITSPRPEIFVFGLTGGDDDKATMYLGFQHPGQFKKNKALVMQILTETDADKRKELLVQLRSKGADELADDVDSLISDREDYLSDPERYLKRGGSRRRKPIPVKPKIFDDEKTDKTDKTTTRDDKDDGKGKKDAIPDGDFPLPKKKTDDTTDDGLAPKKSGKNKHGPTSSDERDDTN